MEKRKRLHLTDFYNQICFIEKSVFISDSVVLNKRGKK